MILASAPAKIILFGEHAVVYGHPAIAVPISSLRARVVVYDDPKIASGLRIFSRQTEFDVLIDTMSAPLNDGFVSIILKFLERVDCFPTGVCIEIDSDIPVAAGLGSGAAVSTAVLRGLGMLLNFCLDADNLNMLVFDAETFYHGTPSGIDNTTVVYEMPVYFIPGHRPRTFEVGSPYYFLIADTGIPAPTREVVDDVRDLLATSPTMTQNIFGSIGDVVSHAYDALEAGDTHLVGQLMTKNHELLRQLTVSCDELDTLVDCALSAGALGAKLSGSGRGGNIIALVNQNNKPSVESALIERGAVRVETCRIG